MKEDINDWVVSFLVAKSLLSFIQEIQDYKRQHSYENYDYNDNGDDDHGNRSCNFNDMLRSISLLDFVEKEFEVLDIVNLKVSLEVIVSTERSSF